jgi:hypothetical protein
MRNADSPNRGKSDFRDLTPAHIREPPGADHVQVLFLESARFYRLFRKDAKFDEIMELLREAMVKKRALQVRCARPDSDLIVEVRPRDLPASD